MYARTRRRLLGALGLNASLLAGCHAATAPEVKADVEPLEGAAADTPKPVVQPTPPPPMINVPRPPPCPSGSFCVDAPKSTPVKPAAGFATCEMTVPPPNGSQRQTFVRFDAEATSEARKKSPAACCYHWTVPCPGGRALRDARGEMIPTPMMDSREWSGAAHPIKSDAALAERWAREASYEHASVASFARTTLELLALGAPPELVAETQAAGLDEVRHAQSMYALARRYGASEAGPGPVRSDRALIVDPAEFALATFHDACVGETVSSLAARADAETAEDPAVRAVLSGIAEDEERHAELAWRTLSWALAKAGPEARASLAAAVDRLEASAREAAAESYRRALDEVVVPCARALVA